MRVKSKSRKYDEIDYQHFQNVVFFLFYVVIELVFRTAYTSNNFEFISGKQWFQKHNKSKRLYSSKLFMNLLPTEKTTTNSF